MKKLYLIWTLLGLLFAPFAWAQNNVTGTVNDETGAPLPGATLPQFIRRGLYPQAEIDNNFDNVPTGISMTDRLWWDRN